MATEVPGEVALEEEKGEGDVGEKGPESITEFYGEAIEKLSTETLVSDFCPPPEDEGEEPGEALWVCQEHEGERGYYKSWRYSMGEGHGEEGEEELEELGQMERSSLDSEYLKEVLGTPLTFALLDIANKRPTDPIQYLGHYLLKWRWVNTDKADYERKMKELNKEREAYKEEQREKERQMMLESEERAEQLRRKERTESSEENLGEGQELGEA